MKKTLLAVALGAVMIAAPTGADAQLMAYPGHQYGISPFSVSYNYLYSPYRYGSGRYHSRSSYGYRSPRSHWDGRDRYYHSSDRSRHSRGDRYDRYSHHNRHDRYDRNDRYNHHDRYSHHSRSRSGSWSGGSHSWGH